MVAVRRDERNEKKKRDVNKVRTSVLVRQSSVLLEMSSFPYFLLTFALTACTRHRKHDGKFVFAALFRSLSCAIHASIRCRRRRVYMLISTT
jgi:hypothetical protein